MAGTYYSLEETMQKLGLSESGVKELVGEGKLSELRDGAKVLFKVDEVDGLASGMSFGQVEISDESSVELMPGESAEIDITDNDDIDLSDLADESINLSEITSADTNVGSVGVNVLDETDEGYALGDSRESTKSIEDSEDGMTGLDEDINLDSVGSGSGLLDLSLQADDTSLGAVLDDILPAAGEAEPEAMGIEEGTMADEADKIFEHAEAGNGLDVQPEQRVAAVQYVEAAPDGVSNACGVAMFLPLLAVVYALIVVIAGLKGITPNILSGIQGIVWYIMGGLAVLSVLIIGIAALMGGKSAKQ